MDLLTMQNELTRVKAENKALREEIRVLSQRMNEAELMLDSCHKTFRDISSIRKPFSQPPPEILPLIFERTLPPRFLLDPLTPLAPNSMWFQVLRQKFSIVNVCRLWHKIGLPFLYEDICISRTYQLSNLLRTLESTSAVNVKDFIKTITIKCSVPKWSEKAVEQQLSMLFANCRQLDRFCCVFPFRLPSLTLLSTSTIRWLQLGEGIGISLLMDILTIMASTLRSLDVYLPDVNNFVYDRPYLSFYCLEDISCGIHTSNDDAIYALNFVARAWIMPRIKRITFRLYGIGACIPNTGLRRFCQAQGSGVKFLHVHPGYYLVWATHPQETVEMQSLLDLCPALEHIVLHPRTQLTPLQHQHIKWVDIWKPVEVLAYEEACVTLKEGITKSAFPMLAGVRVLSLDLAFSYNLPISLPPNMVSRPEDTFSYCFSNLKLTHNVGHIFCPNPLLASEGSDDSDFEVDSASSDSESETSSSTESVDSEQSEVY